MISCFHTKFTHTKNKRSNELFKSQAHRENISPSVHARSTKSHPSQRIYILDVCRQLCRGESFRALRKRSRRAWNRASRPPCTSLALTSDGSYYVCTVKSPEAGRRERQAYVCTCILDCRDRVPSVRRAQRFDVAKMGPPKMEEVRFAEWVFSMGSKCWKRDVGRFGICHATSQLYKRESSSSSSSLSLSSFSHQRRRCRVVAREQTRVARAVFITRDACLPACRFDCSTMRVLCNTHLVNTHIHTRATLDAQTQHHIYIRREV